MRPEPSGRAVPAFHVRVRSPPPRFPEGDAVPSDGYDSGTLGRHGLSEGAQVAVGAGWEGLRGMRSVRGSELRAVRQRADPAPRALPIYARVSPDFLF